MIDIIVCVFKPDLKLFRKCLIQLSRQKLINKIIIVYKDHGDIACVPMFSNIKLIQEPKNSCLAFARYLGIRVSTSEFICFVDSDVILHKNHIQELHFNYLIYGAVIEGILILKDISIKIKLTNNVFTELKPKQRGCTHNTLIKREWVVDWKPIFTYAFEDYLITEHIHKKDISWIRKPLNCKSYHIRDYHIRKRVAWDVAGERLVLNTNKITIVKRIIKHLKRSLIHPFLLKNINYFMYNINISFGITKGYFGHGNYLVLKK